MNGLLRLVTQATLAVISPMLLSIAASAESPALSGTKSIALITAAGEHLTLGRVTFTPDGDGALFKLELDNPELKPEFLSMRPFRCLQDPKEWWCHLDYPYDLKRRVTPADLTDLEYSLLFITKGPNAFGIDAWNGLYFHLDQGPDGTLSGNVHEVDLNVLAVPPADRGAHMIGPAALTLSEPTAHRFARVEIR